MKKFTIYLGLNDKDTKKQEMETIEAYKLLNKIILNDFDGATIYSADGIFKHDNGEIVIEKTFKAELFTDNETSVKNLCNTLKVVFNQESVILQSEVVTSEFI